MPLLDVVQKLARVMPRPTNAEAAAALWTYGTLPAFSTSAQLSRWRQIGGNVDRLGWLAAGYRRPGDKFAAAKNLKHWTSPYPEANALWSMLAQMATVYDREHPGADVPPWPLEMAAGDPAAMKRYLALIWETLQQARAAGIDRGGVPPLPKVPRPPGLPKEPPGGVPKPSLPNMRGGALLLLVLLALALSTRRNR